MRMAKPDKKEADKYTTIPIKESTKRMLDGLMGKQTYNNWVMEKLIPE